MSKILPVKVPGIRASVPCLVDDDVYEWASKRRWCQGAGYPLIRCSGKNKRLHEFLIERTPGKVTDHIDGNPMNNQRSNLRLATYSQNSTNSRRAKDNSSGYKGVSWHKQSGKWRATIMKNGKWREIGRFDEVSDAAVAYEKEALKRHKQFVRI